MVARQAAMRHCGCLGMRCCRERLHGNLAIRCCVCVVHGVTSASLPQQHCWLLKLPESQSPQPVTRSLASASSILAGCSCMTRMLLPGRCSSAAAVLHLSGLRQAAAPTWKIQASFSSSGLDRMRSVMLTICRSALTSTACGQRYRSALTGVVATCTSTAAVPKLASNSLCQRTGCSKEARRHEHSA
jgi:hypothetical protein